MISSKTVKYKAGRISFTQTDATSIKVSSAMLLVVSSCIALIARTMLCGHLSHLGAAVWQRPCMDSQADSSACTTKEAPTESSALQTSTATSSITTTPTAEEDLLHIAFLHTRLISSTAPPVFPSYACAGFSVCLLRRPKISRHFFAQTHQPPGLAHDRDILPQKILILLGCPQ